MEKFEFFPIKCRTERAKQMYHKHKLAADKIQTADAGKKPLKSKVIIAFSIT
jgi:hypothetical protein